MAEDGTPTTPPAGPPDPYAYHGFVVPPFAGRRLVAATVDVAVVGACCLGLLHSFNPLAHDRHPEVWVPSAVVLAVVAAVEILTGVTPGKLLTGLAVRCPDGSRPALWRLAARGAVRLLPVGVFLLGLLTTDPFTVLAVWGFNFTLVSCYVAGNYIPMMRTGRTLFDHIVGTVVVPARGAKVGAAVPPAP
jgi:hypothetical protein